MTPPRDTYHHGDLPHALLLAAEALVRDKGAEGFSLREAARVAGVDPSAVYRHFADKDALLAALATVAFGHLAAAMRAAAGGGPEAEFRAIGAAYVRFALAEPGLFRLMFGRAGAGRDGGVAPPADDPYALLRASLAALGGPVPVDAAALAAWSAVHGLAALLLDRAMPAAAADLALATVLDVVVNGLRGDAGSLTRA